MKEGGLKTDSFFHRFFREFPDAFFTLIGESRQKAKRYKFTSVEVKETAFRFDGIFLPKTKRDLVYFVEVQFQKLSRFYARLFAEIYIYLAQHDVPNDWRAVVIFPKRALDPGVHQHYRELFESGRVICIYLEDLPAKQRERFPLNLLQIISDSEQQVLATVKKLTRQLPKQIHGAQERERIFQLIITLLMSKFPQLTRKEAEKMVQPMLSDPKESRWYKELVSERVHEIAQIMLKKKMAPALVEELTGLSAREVRALNKKPAARKRASVSRAA